MKTSVTTPDFKTTQIKLCKSKFDWCYAGFDIINKTWHTFGKAYCQKIGLEEGQVYTLDLFTKTYNGRTEWAIGKVYSK